MILGKMILGKMAFRAALAGLTVGIATAAIAATAISQKDKTFSQESVTVKAGEKIKFVNDDTVTHNLTVKTPGGTARPGVQEKPGDEIELAFDEAGTYEVRCLIHPKMKMSVEAN
jgi:cytochrome c peroxidase